MGKPSTPPFDCPPQHHHHPLPSPYTCFTLCCKSDFSSSSSFYFLSALSRYLTQPSGPQDPAALSSAICSVCVPLPPPPPPFISWSWGLCCASNALRVRARQAPGSSPSTSSSASLSHTRSVVVFFFCLLGDLLTKAPQISAAHVDTSPGGNNIQPRSMPTSARGGSHGCPKANSWNTLPFPHPPNPPQGPRKHMVIRCSALDEYD